MGDRSPSPPIDRRVSSLRRRYYDLNWCIESCFEQNWRPNKQDIQFQIFQPIREKLHSIADLSCDWLKEGQFLFSYFSNLNLCFMIARN